jgi:hypothetical protein
MMTAVLAPYLAIVTAVIAAYMTFRNQQRLKAFELLYVRREAVFKDLEAQLARIHALQSAFRKRSTDAEPVDNYQLFFEGQLIVQKVKGARFGAAADQLADSYQTILDELFRDPDNLDLMDWLDRCRNALSILYGASHRDMSHAIESLTVSAPVRWWRVARRR